MLLDETRNRILIQMGVEFSIDFQKKNPLDQEARADMRLVDELGWSEGLYQYYLKKYDHDWIAQFIFGSKGNYNAFLAGRENPALEKQMIEEGTHPYFANEEDAKAFHANDHFPVLSVNENHLGTVPGGIDMQLLSSGMINEFTPEGIIKYARDVCGERIPIAKAEEMAKRFNKMMEQHMMEQLQGSKNRNDPTVETVSQIRKHCIEKNSSFEESDAKAKMGRQIASNLSHSVADFSAAVVIHKDNPSKLKKAVRRFLASIEDSSDVVLSPMYEQTMFASKGVTKTSKKIQPTSSIDSENKS